MGGVAGGVIGGDGMLGGGGELGGGKGGPKQAKRASSIASAAAAKRLSTSKALALSSKAWRSAAPMQTSCVLKPNSCVAKEYSATLEVLPVRLDSANRDE